MKYRPVSLLAVRTKVPAYYQESGGHHADGGFHMTARYHP